MAIPSYVALSLNVGTFQVRLSNGSTIKGAQTFDDQAYFNNLFGTLVDLRPYQGLSTSTSSGTTSSAKTEDTKASTTTQAEESTKTTDTNSISRKVLLDQLNSAYKGLIIDDTSNVETILDNYCWKKGASLTSAQRIRIIDGIDPLLSVYEIEKEIENTMKTLNVSA